MDWGRMARWLAAAVIIGFATLGVWAMLEGEVPCEGQPPARNGTAACFPGDGDPGSTEDWLVKPGG